MNLSEAAGTDANQQQQQQQQQPEEQPPASPLQQLLQQKATQRVDKFTQFYRSLEKTKNLAAEMCAETRHFENYARILGAPEAHLQPLVSGINGLPNYLRQTLSDVAVIRRFYEMTLPSGISAKTPPTPPLTPGIVASGSNGSIVKQENHQPADETEEEIIDPGSAPDATNRGTVAEQQQQVEAQQQPNQELAATTQQHSYANAYIGLQHQQLSPAHCYPNYYYYFYWLHNYLANCRAALSDPQALTKQQEPERDASQQLAVQLNKNAILPEFWENFKAVREGKIVIQPEDSTKMLVEVDKGNPSLHSSGKKPTTLLLPFLLKLLLNEEMSELIQFTGRRYEFIIKNTEGMAKLWGQQKIDKNGGNMNYDKFSRAIRYYYDKQPGIIKGEDSQP